MSTRARKSTASTTSETPRGGVSTPTGTPRSKASHRSSSPLSPTRISRLQEKADLQNLNDRLAAYIDRVRHLELENNRLNVQVETIHESVQKEVTSMKGLYEQELGDTRKLLDETAKERAQLQIDVGRIKAENEDLLSRLHRKERDLGVAERGFTQAESQLADVTKRLNALENERKKNLQELKDLRDENAKLLRQLSEAKTQLEAETLMRVDLENRCESLKEEMQFKQQMYEKEITETKKKRTIEVSEIDGRLQEEYEHKLQDALQELRQQYEDQMAYNRGEVESIYEAKIEDLNYRLSRGVDDAAGTKDQLQDSKLRVEELTSRLGFLENTNNTLQQRVNDLESLLAAERDSYRSEIMNLKDEIEHLRDQMTEQLQEYQDLMDIKVALDMEISAYRKLLESEETRLNLSALTGKSFDGKETPIRRTPMKAGMKRKRDIVEEETSKSAFQSTAMASGDLHIVEECPEGTFIRLENKGQKNFAIGGYQLTRTANGAEVSYKFNRQLKVPSESIIAIYSSDSDETHDAPHTLVMRNQKWPVADTMVTSLSNSDSEEIATRESKRQQETRSTSIHYGRYPGSQQSFSTSPRGGQSPEKCSVM